MTASTLERSAEAYEKVCPHVLGNPYIPHRPHPKQAALLGAHLGHDYAREAVFEMLFGGAAGPGKSYGIEMLHAQMAWKYSHYRGLILRRKFPDLIKAGAIMSRAVSHWRPLGVHWSGETKTATFPNGATVEFGYHFHPDHDDQYQGGEWHCVSFDELTQWPDSSAFMWLRSRIRKNVGDPIPLRLVSASNPGGPGHVWVKNRFIGGKDVSGRRVTPVSLYLPATIDDNPSLDRESYKQTLMGMHPTRRAQLLDGDWGAREPGDYFRQEWFGPLLEPDLHPIPRNEAVGVRWWDLAASEQEAAARTAGVLMVRFRAGARAVAHATAFRATPGKRDSKIVQQAHVDGRHVVVGLEIEPGSGGPAQFEYLSKTLRSQGFRVAGARPRVGKPQLSELERASMTTSPVALKGKQGRAEPVSSCLERGYQRRGECEDSGEAWWGVDVGRGYMGERDGLRLYSGPWTQGYLDEVEGAYEGTLVDLADATAGAWAYLEAHPFGMRLAPTDKKPHEPAELANIHPADRPEQMSAGKDRSGRWRP